MKPKLFAPLSRIKKPVASTHFYAQCHNGHTHHKTVVLERSLRGQPIPRDMPVIRTRYGRDLIIEVYDWRKYFTVGADLVPHQKYDQFCTGQDIVSYCIDMQGLWEGYDTLLTLDILSEKRTKDVVLDFGSHLGWYTILAATAGYRVAALDGNPENIELVKRNANRNGVAKLVSPYLCWLDDRAPFLSVDEENVHFLKADVEGAERIVFAMANGLFSAKKVKYAIFEISPVFNGSYPDLVEKIAANGYDVYMIPGKTWEHTPEFAIAPLETVQKYCLLPESGRREFVAGLHQENFLFVRRER